MSNDRTEACGRCSMTAVVDAASVGRSEEERAARDPFAGERIEVDEREVRRVAPAAWLGGVKSKLDDVGMRLIHRR